MTKIPPAVDPWSETAGDAEPPPAQTPLPREPTGAWAAAPVAPTRAIDLTGRARRRRTTLIAASVVGVIAIVVFVSILTSDNNNTLSATGGNTPAASAGTSHAGAGTGGGAGSGAGTSTEAGSGAGTPSTQTSRSAAAPCEIGTWDETSETLTVDSATLFGTGSGNVTLTLTTPSETRVFNADGTGQIDVIGNKYRGTTSNGIDVSIVLAGQGTFQYTFGAGTVTYRNVRMPGTYEVDVNGVRRSVSHPNPLYANGSGSMTCSGNTLTQDGDSYDRIYQRQRG